MKFLEKRISLIFSTGQKAKDDSKFRGIRKESVSSNGLLNQPNPIGILTFPANKVLTSIPDRIISAGMYGTDTYDVELLEDTEVKSGIFIKPVKLSAKFKWSQDYLNKEIDNGTIIRIPTMKFSPSYEKKEYAPEVPANLINSKVGVDTNENASAYQLQLFSKKVFNYPKPISLIQYLMQFKDDDQEQPFWIMDFFSGSGTTAEACMKFNQALGYNHCKYILVQLPEDMNEALANAKNPSEKEIIQNAIDFLQEQGSPLNLCELAKERIRRASRKIKEDSPLTTQKLDTGFRVLKLDSSNMEDVFYAPAEVSQGQLFSYANNVKPDRTNEDLLFQMMLELGATLDSKIEKSIVCGKNIFNVADGYIVACFDDEVSDDVVKAIAQMQPLYAVLRDSSLANDSTATNFEQIFKTYSPSTTCKIL